MSRGLMMGGAPVWDKEGGGGGDGGGDGDGGDGGGGGVWTPPADLPENYRGANADEVLGKVLPDFLKSESRVAELRGKLSQLPGAPKSVDEYQFEFSDDVKPFMGADFDKNPIAAITRSAAHEMGLSNTQTNGFINKVYGEAAKAGLLLPPLDAAAEVSAYKKHSGFDDEGVTQRFTENETFAKGLVTQLKGIPDDPAIKAELSGLVQSLTDTAAGNFLLSALSGRLAESGFKVAGEGGDGGAMNDDEFKRAHGDPRIDPTNRNHKDPTMRYDEQLRARYDEATRQRTNKNK